jgi:serine/threonine protein kinase/tetratricopeptide (TPR) repeat protein
MNEETLFHQALEMPDPGARSAFLDRACTDRPHLRARLERLLEAHDHPIPLLDQRAADLVGVDSETGPPSAGPESATPLPGSSPEGLGDRVGAYRLVQKLGEGGMGAVYLAEQTEPVRRQVALKVIKPGLDSAEVIARFAVERQALALMDHPHIARVLDAGTTASGRPFFVMELVRGTPITRYCDEERLPLRLRLELFVLVCSALQHAHQKGVLHRDVKASNVLVALCDGRPVVKVIDFGVAKAVGQPLTEQTLVTGLGALVGTLEYMSPEQAELNNQDIDTRSDVYSLGVLLYELLTGTTPLTRQRLKQTPLPELLRLIREEEATRPSVRVSQSADSRESIAARRQTEPGKLTKLLRGDLDWIVMRALEKDRARRYQTANDLARDVERYLRDEPVEAGPPSASYRLWKFSWKYRRVLAVAGCFLVLLLAGVAVCTWQTMRATLAEERAQKNEALARAEEEKVRQKEAEARGVLAFQDVLLVAARPEGQEGGLGPDLTIREVVDRAEPRIGDAFAGQPAVEASIRYTLGMTYEHLGESERAIRQIERARALYETLWGADNPYTLRSMSSLAGAYRDAGRLADAVTLAEEAFRRHRARLGPDHLNTVSSMLHLAGAYRAAGRAAEAVPLCERAVAVSRTRLGPEHHHTVTAVNNLAAMYRDVGRLAEALALHEEVLKLRTAQLGPDHPYTLTSMNNLATTYRELGRFADAIGLHEAALKVQKARLGPDHPHTLNNMNNLAGAYRDAGRLADGLALHEETVKLQKARLGPDHPNTLSGMNNLALAYREAGRLTEALTLHEQVLRARKVKEGPDHPRTLIGMHNLAVDYELAGRRADALPLWEETTRLRKSRLGPAHPLTLESLTSLAKAYQQAGRPDQAEALFRENLELQRRKPPADSPRVAEALEALGAVLLELGKHADAEPLLREGLEIRRRKMPDSWMCFHAASLLGGSLLGQKKYAEAEPLLLEGAEGMRARQERIPLASVTRLSEAVERVVRLYEVTQRKEKADEWRKKREEALAAARQKG